MIIGGLLGIALLSPFALRAQTLDQVKAQLISQLLELISQLQTQLDILIAERDGTSVVTNTNSNLVSGTNGVDVYETDKKIADVGDYLDGIADDFAKTGSGPSLSKVQSLSSGIDSVILFGESQTSVVGGKVTLSGQGLSGSITVHFSDDYSLKNQGANSFGQVVFTVPNIPKGTYDLIVSNNKGVSNSIDLIVQ